jgi:hypothetical protein
MPAVCLGLLRRDLLPGIPHGALCSIEIATVYYSVAAMARITAGARPFVNGWVGPT